MPPLDIEKFKTLSPEAQQIVLDKQGISTEAQQIIKSKVQIVQPSQKPMEELSFKDLPSNILPSTFEAVKNIATAITSPIQTVEGVRDLIIGGFSKALDPIGSIEEKKFEAASDFFIERFGGIENIKKTAIEDPAGFALDLSSVLSGGAGLLAKTGQATKLNLLVKAGEKGSQLARVIDPFGAVGAGVGALAKLRKPKNTLIKTALQFRQIVKGERGRLQKIDNLAQAFLESNFKVTRKSLKAIDAERRKVNAEINRLIDQSTDAGIVKDIQPIVDLLDDTISTALEKGLEVNAINQMIKLKNDFIAVRGSSMNPRELQTLKKGLNEAFKPNLSDSFGAIKSVMRDKQRQGAKLMLEDIRPQLKELNPQDATLKQFNQAISRRLETLEAQPIIASKGLVAGGVAGASAGAITQEAGKAVKFGVSAALFSKLVDSPNVQISIARMLHKANLKLAKAGKITDITRPTFQIGRLQDLTEETPEGAQSTLGGRKKKKRKK